MLRENLFILYVDDFLEGDSFMNGLLLLGLSALIFSSGLFILWSLLS